MSKLTIRGIVWEISSYNGKASFTHLPLNITITYHPSVGEYAVWTDKHEYFSSPDVADCLDMSTDVILDLYATQFPPSWDNDEAPITERTPTMCDAAAE